MAAIVAAADELLQSEGYDSVNTNRIALRAGVSVGSLYRYFPNKDAILAVLVRDRLDARITALARRLARLGEAPLAALVGCVVEQVVGAHLEDQELRRLTEDDIPRSSLDHELVACFARAADLLAAELEARGYQVGESGRSALFTCVVTTEALARTARQLPPGEVRARVLEELTSMVVAHLTARLGQRSGPSSWGARSM